MQVTVHFYSYFKELAGTAQAALDLPPQATLDFLRARILEQFPRLAPLQKSMLAAVGVEYQPWSFALSEGDEVSFFPPVQGG